MRTAAVHDEAMFWEPPIKVRQTAHTRGASSLHRVPWPSGFPFRRDRLANCIIISMSMFFCKNTLSQKSVQNYEKNSKYARKTATFRAFRRNLCGNSYFFEEKVTSHPLNSCQSPCSSTLASKYWSRRFSCSMVWHLRRSDASNFRIRFANRRLCRARVFGLR